MTTTVDRLFAAGLSLLGLYIIWNALDYGYMREAVPGPGFFPLWVGLGLTVLSAANLVRSLRGHEVLDTEFDRATVAKTLAIVALVIGFILITPLIGMVIASGLLIPAIAFAIRPRWTGRFAATMLVIAVAFPVLCHFLFGVYLQVPLVRGVFGI